MSIKCLVVDDEQMTRTIIARYIDQTESLEGVSVCETPIEAANVLSKQKIDLLFLDVQMPEMNGFDLIRSMTQKPKIIIISSSKEYALDAFEYDVVDYLHKPISYSRFLKAVEKVKKTVENGKDDSSIYVKKGSGLTKVGIKEILWVEAYADYVIIKTPEKSYTVHSTMKGMEKKLPAGEFCRVHRSYIVRLDKIDSIEDSAVVVERKVIPVGGSYKQIFKQQLNLI
ncbi:MAG: response regulator transcription factor [Chlorobiales bacterium]|jgi:DNA-binding LytR/AlgR family response regulator|nr:response regulator transcription factor [Chlorobiales bacterium]